MQAEDEIVYYSDNEKAKAAAGAIEDGGGKDEAFEIVDPPDDLDEVEEDGSAPSTGADRSEEEAEVKCLR